MRTRIIAVLAVAAIAGAAWVGRARAADHLDGSSLFTTPEVDITDLYSWMPDATHVALVMDVYPLATTTATFSTTAKYVFHTAGYSAFNGTADPEVDVICTFDGSTPQHVSCWVGTQEYVQGDASGTAGIATADGKVKVFTGLRDDPFFFNQDGFNNMKMGYEGAGPFTLDAAGCPSLNGVASGAFLNDLSHGMTGGAPTDHYAGDNVLAIVLQVDKSLLLSGGHTLLSVWASTNQ